MSIVVNEKRKNSGYIKDFTGVTNDQTQAEAMNLQWLQFLIFPS